jgi:hypothetical protein
LNLNPDKWLDTVLKQLGRPSNNSNSHPEVGLGQSQQPQVVVVAMEETQ